MMISRLCFMFATVVALGLSSAQAQNGAPPSYASLSPLMKQAFQAMQRGDNATGEALMRRAAEQGDLVAQADLGGFYLEGRTLPANRAEGLRLLRNVVARHQEPSYSVAMTALQRYGQAGPPRNMAEALRGVHEAVKALQEDGRRKLQSLDPETRQWVETLARTPGPQIMMCTGPFCF